MQKTISLHKSKTPSSLLWPILSKREQIIEKHKANINVALSFKEKSTLKVSTIKSNICKLFETIIEELKKAHPISTISDTRIALNKWKTNPQLKIFFNEKETKDDVQEIEQENNLKKSFEELFQDFKLITGGKVLEEWLVTEFTKLTESLWNNTEESLDHFLSIETLLKINAKFSQTETKTYEVTTKPYSKEFLLDPKCRYSVHTQKTTSRVHPELKRQIISNPSAALSGCKEWIVTWMDELSRRDLTGGRAEKWIESATEWMLVTDTSRKNDTFGKQFKSLYKNIKNKEEKEIDNAKIIAELEEIHAYTSKRLQELNEVKQTLSTDPKSLIEWVKKTQKDSPDFPNIIEYITGSRSTPLELVIDLQRYYNIIENRIGKVLRNEAYKTDTKKLKHFVEYLYHSHFWVGFSCFQAKPKQDRKKTKAIMEVSHTAVFMEASYFGLNRIMERRGSIQNKDGNFYIRTTNWRVDMIAFTNSVEDQNSVPPCVVQDTYSQKTQNWIQTQKDKKTGKINNPLIKKTLEYMIEHHILLKGPVGDPIINIEDLETLPTTEIIFNLEFALHLPYKKPFFKGLKEFTQRNPEDGLIEASKTLSKRINTIRNFKKSRITRNHMGKRS